MYYRFIIKKNNQISGLFHPKENWSVPKEGGLYDVVRKNFSTLGYSKNFKGKSQSWFTESGVEAFKSGIEELKEFYSLYGVTVSMQSKENLTDIVDQDEFQVWCLKK